MPRRGWTPRTYRLLGYPRHDWSKKQDEDVREAVKGALSKREVAQRLYEHSTFWREWK